MIEKRRTREELVMEAFALMRHLGDLTLRKVRIVLQTGGIIEKEFYKVKPREK